MQLTQPTTRCSMTVHEQVSQQHDRTGKAVRGTRGMHGLSRGTSVAVWFRLPALHVGQSVAHGQWAGALRQLSSSAVRPRRDGVPRHAHSLADMVSCDVASLCQQERNECSKPPATAGIAELQHGVALSPQAEAGHGQTWQGTSFRNRGGGRDISGRLTGREAGTRGVWQGTRFHRRGDSRAQDRQDQTPLHLGCVWRDAGDLRNRRDPERSSHQIRRVERIQRHQGPWIRTRGCGQDRRRTWGDCLTQMPSGYQPSETMDSGNLTGQRWLRASSRLFERVHVPVQPEKLEVSGSAFPPAGGTGGCHRPQPSIYDHTATRPEGGLSHLHIF